MTWLQVQIIVFVVLLKLAISVENERYGYRLFFSSMIALTIALVNSILSIIERFVL